MATEGSRTRRRRWWALAIAVVLIGAALVVVRVLVLNDVTHQLTTAEALDRFRDSAPSAPGTTTTTAPLTTARRQQTLPALGVYRYATVGRESIDALDGAEHVYPDETTITYTSADCGVQLQWDALKERHDVWRLCITSEGIELQPTGGAYHVFFGQEKVEDLACDRSVLLIAAEPPATTSSEPAPLTCTIGGAPWFPVWQVLERTTRTVQGTDVAVQHVQMTVTDEDQYHEHITLDWFLDDHGLLIAAELAKETLADTVVGGVTYKETFSLALISPDPLR
ncbi:MAG: hypothetical protein HY826_02505 [Actinobacteria bacterium]|nr:hypothetical protein [Actinomycetota bacterium]